MSAELAEFVEKRVRLQLEKADPAAAAALLAEYAIVTAYRRVADDDDGGAYEWAYGYATGLGLAARAIAARFAHHPGYREEWRPPFTCPLCLRTSYNPHDRQQGYCGACHAVTGTPATGHRHSAERVM